MKEIIQTSDAPAPIGPYSQAVKAGNLMFLSGQIAINPATNEMVTHSLEAETRQVMDNIGAVLKAERMTYHNIVKTSIFLKDMNDFGEINQVYGSYFEQAFPARETVEVSRLPKDVRVEISVIAVGEG
ncbi:MAG: RidA family protein [Bacteroidota bacterium]